ncbi:hypothetical protein [Paeniroseomonas aquatica]
MLAQFIYALRGAGIPASITEYLTLLQGMKEGSPTTASTTSTTCPARPW